MSKLLFWHPKVRAICYIFHPLLLFYKNVSWYRHKLLLHLLWPHHIQIVSIVQQILSPEWKLWYVIVVLQFRFWVLLIIVLKYFGVSFRQQSKFLASSFNRGSFCSLARCNCMVPHLIFHWFLVQVSPEKLGVESWDSSCILFCMLKRSRDHDKLSIFGHIYKSCLRLSPQLIFLLFA